MESTRIQEPAETKIIVLATEDMADEGCHALIQPHIADVNGPISIRIIRDISSDIFREIHDLAARGEVQILCCLTRYCRDWTKYFKTNFTQVKVCYA